MGYHRKTCLFLIPSPHVLSPLNLYTKIVSTCLFQKHQIRSLSNVAQKSMYMTANVIALSIYSAFLTFVLSRYKLAQHNFSLHHWPISALVSWSDLSSAIKSIGVPQENLSFSDSITACMESTEFIHKNRLHVSFWEASNTITFEHSAKVYVCDN